MNVYLLTKVINNSSDEKLISLFDNEKALQAHVSENYPPRIQDTRLVPHLELHTLRVRTLQTETPLVTPASLPTPVVEDVDFADAYVTVPSQTDSSQVYSVAVNVGSKGKIKEVLACSCPAFGFHPEKGSCKHMWAVQVNPRYYGIQPS